MLRAAIGAVISILAVSLRGSSSSGWPLRGLTDFSAKRIGAGDSSASLNLRQRDEMGELAGEMNQMCVRFGRPTSACARRLRPASAPSSSSDTSIGCAPWAHWLRACARAGDTAQRRVGAREDGGNRGGCRRGDHRERQHHRGLGQPHRERSSVNCWISPAVGLPTGGAMP